MRMSIPGEVPRRDTNDRLSSRMVTFAVGWMPTAHLHLFTDLEGLGTPVKVRLAYFKNGGLLKFETVEVKSNPDYKATSRVLPPGTEAVQLTRLESSPTADEAACGFRIDMWD